MRNKTALITGATGGLGTEFANIHAAKGGDLLLVGRNQEKLDAMKKELEEKYTGKVRLFAVRTMEQDLSMLSVNVVTVTKLLKLFLPDFIRRGEGKILNVSSTAALTPGPLQAEYYATKAYVTSLSNAIWQEVKGTGVTVTALMPGAMKTGFAEASDMSKTPLFANVVNPVGVAKAGYDGMLKGKLNVFAGLPGWQKPFMSLMPMFPKKPVMIMIYQMQKEKK